MLESLWPEFGVPVEQPTIALLSEQASVLSRQTRGRVTADVSIRPGPGPASQGLYMDFELVVPSLDGYRYGIFSIWQSVEGGYPVYVVAAPWEIKAAEHLGNFGQFYERLDSEEALRDFMRRAFNHERIRRIMENLLASSRALAS